LEPLFLGAVIYPLVDGERFLVCERPKGDPPTSCLDIDYSLGKDKFEETLSNTAVSIGVEKVNCGNFFKGKRDLFIQKR
jgi:hypothetical protein